MADVDYSKTLCEKINELRKRENLTQEQLADKLGITFQAVSKWENGLSCPDIALLPILGDIFKVRIDELFGRANIEEKQCSYINDTPWKDDNKLRAVVYIGKKLMLEPIEEAGKFTFEYSGDALDVETYFPIICGDVEGDVNTKNGAVQCGDVSGDVNACGSVSCGDVEGDVSANGSVACSDIGGDVSTNGSITCDSIEGDVSTSGDVKADSIGGDVTAKNGNVTTDSIEGDVHANSVDCDEINGDVYCNKVNCVE